MLNNIRNIELAINKKCNKEALAYFKKEAAYPLTKGKIRTILHQKSVYWFGRKDSFRKNNTHWNEYIVFFNNLIKQSAH